MSVEYAVILVESTSHALRIEKLITHRGLSCKLIPVPRHLSSDCGVCVRIIQKEMKEVQALLNEQNIFPPGIEAI